jgi:hypothetical protein
MFTVTEVAEMYSVEVRHEKFALRIFDLPLTNTLMTRKYCCVFTYRHNTPVQHIPVSQYHINIEIMYSHRRDISVQRTEYRLQRHVDVCRLFLTLRNAAVWLL